MFYFVILNLIVLQLTSTAPTLLYQTFLTSLINTYRFAIQTRLQPTLDEYWNITLLSPQTYPLAQWRSFQTIGQVLTKRQQDASKIAYWQDGKDLSESEWFLPVSDAAQIVKRDSSGSQNGDYVLVTSWIPNGQFFEPHIGSPIALQRELWVTLFPQVQQFCQSLSSDYKKPIRFIRSFLPENKNESSWLELRLIQYLGLSPVLPATRTHFVSFWVNLNDLYRPCLNPSLDQTRCDFTVIQNQTVYLYNTTTGEQIEVSQNDNESQGWSLPWFFDLLSSGIYSFNQQDIDSIFPWTRLGYTYDWGLGGGSYEVQGETVTIGENQVRSGATEFYIRNGAVVYVDSVDTTLKYCE